MTSQKVDKVYEKYAWVIFTVIGLLIFVGGAPHTLGNNSNPDVVESFVGMTTSEFKASNQNFYDVYDYYFRGGGWSDMGFGFFVIVISATLFRKGDRFAWYILWSVPVFFLGHAAIALNFGQPTSLFIPFLTVFVILSLLGLVLPVRKYFPK
jgi:hypothetical protein